MSGPIKAGDLVMVVRPASCCHDAARAAIPRPMTDEVILIGLHKSRYMCTAIAPELRHASGAWLRERGYRQANGLPLLPEGDLPE